MILTLPTSSSHHDRLAHSQQGVCMLPENQATAAQATGLRSLQEAAEAGPEPLPRPGPSMAQLGALSTQGVSGKHLFQRHKGLPGSTLAEAGLGDGDPLAAFVKSPALVGIGKTKCGPAANVPTGVRPCKEHSAWVNPAIPGPASVSQSGGRRQGSMPASLNQWPGLSPQSLCCLVAAPAAQCSLSHTVGTHGSP